MDNQETLLKFFRQKESLPRKILYIVLNILIRVITFVFLTSWVLNLGLTFYVSIWLLFKYLTALVSSQLFSIFIGVIIFFIVVGMLFAFLRMFKALLFYVDKEMFRFFSVNKPFPVDLDKSKVNFLRFLKKNFEHLDPKKTEPIFFAMLTINSASVIYKMNEMLREAEVPYDNEKIVNALYKIYLDIKECDYLENDLKNAVDLLLKEIRTVTDLTSVQIANLFEFFVELKKEINNGGIRSIRFYDVAKNFLSWPLYRQKALIEMWQLNSRFDLMLNHFIFNIALSRDDRLGEVTFELSFYKVMKDWLSIEPYQNLPSNPFFYEIVTVSFDNIYNLALKLLELKKTILTNITLKEVKQKIIEPLQEILVFSEFYRYLSQKNGVVDWPVFLKKLEDIMRGELYIRKNKIRSELKALCFDSKEKNTVEYVKKEIKIRFKDKKNKYRIQCKHLFYRKSSEILLMLHMKNMNALIFPKKERRNDAVFHKKGLSLFDFKRESKYFLRGIKHNENINPFDENILPKKNDGVKIKYHSLLRVTTFIMQTRERATQLVCGYSRGWREQGDTKSLLIDLRDIIVSYFLVLDIGGVVPLKFDFECDEALSSIEALKSIALADETIRDEKEFEEEELKQTCQNENNQQLKVNIEKLTMVLSKQGLI